MELLWWSEPCNCEIVSSKLLWNLFPFPHLRHSFHRSLFSVYGVWHTCLTFTGTSFGARVLAHYKEYSLCAKGDQGPQSCKVQQKKFLTGFWLWRSVTSAKTWTDGVCKIGHLDSSSPSQRAWDALVAQHVSVIWCSLDQNQWTLRVPPPSKPEGS